MFSYYDYSTACQGGIMDLKKKLEEAKAKRKQLVEQANQLAEQRQAVLQEALKFDGEVRVLEELAKEEKK